MNRGIHKTIYSHLRPGIIIAGVLLAMLLYYLIDPGETAYMPRCMFHAVTGYDCPGCGMQRMVHALLHLDIKAAWQANPFLMCVMPFCGFMVVVDIWKSKYPTLYRNFNSVTAIITILVIIIAWWIIRNIMGI